MNEPRFTTDSDLRLSIERLAADELDCAGRRKLFESLDREPLRWRICALALLETRELEGALGAWKREAAETRASPTRCSENRPVVREVGRPWRRRLVSIACLALAFACGLAVESHRNALGPKIVQWAPDSPAGGEAAREPPNVSQTGPPVEPRPNREQAISEVAPLVAENHLPLRNAAGSIPPYVRSQLERQGYRVESFPGEASLALPDGRQVKVPVDRLKFQYVGQRSL